MKSKSNPFLYIDAVGYTKEEGVIDELGENNYSEFLTNRHFSYFIDSIHFANMMNCYPFLDKKLQFDFYLNQLRKKKRFRKWTKKTVENKVKILIDYYQISTIKAMEIIDLFNDDDIAEIEKLLEKGGKENKNVRG